MASNTKTIFYINDASYGAGVAGQWNRKLGDGYEVIHLSGYQELKDKFRLEPETMGRTALVMTDYILEPHMHHAINGCTMIEYVRDKLGKTAEVLPALILSGAPPADFPDNTKLVYAAEAVHELESTAELITQTINREKLSDRAQELIIPSERYQLEFIEQTTSAREGDIPEDPNVAKRCVDNAPEVALTPDDVDKTKQGIVDRLLREIRAIENEDRRGRLLSKYEGVFNKYPEQKSR